MKSHTIFYALISPIYAAVHESLLAIPKGWKEADVVVLRDRALDMKVSLKHRNLDKLESMIREVSDPASPQYGQYIHGTDVSAIFGPSEDTIDAVHTWLHESGARAIEKRHGDISFSISVGEANKMFETEFKLYKRGTREKLRTTQYSVPDSLTAHIDLITPTIYFGSNEPRALQPVGTTAKYSKRDLDLACLDIVPEPNASNGTDDWPAFGPRCVSQQYGTAGYSVDTSAGSSIAFGSFAHQSASHSDLAIYEQKLKLPKSNFTKLASINNGTFGQDPDEVVQYEANLDVQIIAGLVGGLPIGEYSTGGFAPFIPNAVFPNVTYNWNEPFLDYYEYLLAQPEPSLPWVISNSYADYENTVPVKYANRVCNLIGMLGLRGRTILHASGDMGVGELCENSVTPHQPQFAAQFPGSCPYVTTVGGTQDTNPEIGWNESSGGFSFYFPRPWYQDQAIKTYLEQNLPATVKDYYESNNYTNLNGRGFPDISAHSMYPWIPTVEEGRLQLGGGASAACPIIASVVALINDARFRSGRPAVGFANPWLYAMASKGLNDITEGGTTGCWGPFFDPYTGEDLADAPFIPYATWNATAGWDPVTGLGTPDFEKMKDL